MRKLTFLFALLCASVMGWAATQYCGETSPNSNFTFTLKNVSGNTYRIQFDAIGADKFVSAYNINCGVNQSAGAGIFFGGDNATNWVFTDDQAYLDFTTASAGSVPTGFYGNYFCFNKKGGGLIEISNFNPADVDWTAACSAGDATPPTMISATKASQTYNTVVINVAADDNVGVTKYVIKNHSDDSEVGEYTPAAGQITVEGLTPETAYDWDVYAKDAAGNVSVAGINVTFTTDAAPSNIYCAYEIGHEGNPSADLNSFILLSVGSDGNGHTIVNVKQDDAKNSAMFDYINIVGKKDIGADVATGGSDEMAIVFPTPTPDGDGNIALDIQWSTINWGGRWQCHVELPADATCATADPFPGDNTYCSYTDNQLRANNANVALTWGTDGSGNVIVDISDGEGATNTAFRNGGFENEGSFAATWFVYSGTNHTTCEPATTYFNNGGTLSNENKRFTLTKKANLPANAVIAFFGHAFSWRTDQAIGAYHEKKYFGYQYGYNCPILSAPTNVAVDGSKVITFDAVANAETYTAKVYLDGILKHQQVVASGDVLSFTPYTTGTYQVQVVADAAGYPTSEPSTAYDWALTAPAIVVGNSEYCEYAIGSGTSAAALTWETSVDGSITITIQEVLGGAADATHFRGTGMNISNFQVGEAKTSASAYFNHACGGSNQVTLTLKNASVKPGLGEKIYYTDKVVEWATSGNNNAYSNLTFEYTYGTVCSGQKHVTVAVNNNEWGSATVNGGASADVDAGTTVTCVATPATGYEFVNWTKGGVEVATTATYTPTIDAATDLVANFDYERTTYCYTPVLTNQGKKVYLTVGKGTTEGTYQIKIYGSTELPITGIYNANTAMNFIKFGELDGNDIYLTVANSGWSYSATGNGVISSAEIRPRTGYTWRDIWNWGGTLEFNEGVLHNINSTLQQRYYFNWNNDCVDAEKPVMTSASLASNTASTAVLNVAATDDHVVDAFHVVDGTNGIDEIFPVAAQITLTGLVGGTTYNFEVTAIDAAGKESDTPAEVEVTMAAAASPVPTVAAPVPTWPADQVKSIYSDSYDFAPTSLNSYNEGWYIQPTLTTEEIAGNHYLKYSGNMNGMVGWQFEAISVSTMEYVHVDIWPSVDGTINMGPTSADDPNRVASVTLDVTAGQWNSFDISIADLVAANANFDPTKLFQNQFTNYSDQTTFSVDNVFFYRTTPPPADSEAPTNVTASVTEQSFTSVKISAQADDDSGVVHFKVKNGSNELVSDVEAVSGTAITITVSVLTPNTAYNFSVIAFDEAGHSAEPVAVAATTRAVPPAAPLPTHREELVLSVYSNAYTPAVAESFNKTNWGSAPVAYEADYLLYNMSSNVIVWGNNDGNAGYGNIDGVSGHTYDTKTGLDVSGMTYIHFDIWCDAADQLNTVNINDVAVAIPTTRTVAGEWVSFDVNITGVALADRQNVRWLKFHPFNTANCNAAIDNVYFWSYGAVTTPDNGGETGGWATFSCAEKVAVPAGVTAYKAVYEKTATEEVMNLTDIGDVIPAGEGVILKGDAGTAYAFSVTDATPTEDMSDNMLVGCPVRTDITSVLVDNDVFCLRYSEAYSMTGFFLYTGQYVPAGKAYLALPKATPGAGSTTDRGLRFVINDSEQTTAITSVETENTKITKFVENGQLFIRRGDTVYTIQGTRVK